jgi:predicted nucleic acid-binding protein
MTDAERMTFARLLSSRQVGQMGLLAPLGPGEAACVAIAIAREWILASDDSDALAALEQLNPGHPYERIRRLLQRAANEGRVSRREANEIHREMIRLGFRDRTRPFPREPD